MDVNSTIFVAGHRGLVGSALVQALRKKGFRNLLLPSHAELDLIEQSAVRAFFQKARPQYVVMAAARVGGILYNQRYQADFLYENLMIGANVIKAAADFGTEKLLFLGSSCIYPKLATQPIHEDSLLTGPLEPTNEGYAVAKIAGLKLCEKYFQQCEKRFISAMPTNLYGPEDNFHPEHSHVIPGILRRFHEAKLREAPAVQLWGTGTPRREFLYIDDLAAALLILLERYEEPEIVNVGTGEDCTIRELAELVKEIVGYEGAITLDTSKPDGTPRKVLDVARMRSLGWAPQVSLRDGLTKAYTWALETGALTVDSDRRLS